MKKNLSVIVLIVEIASISLLHAVKIRQTEKINSDNSTPRYSSSKPDIRLRPTSYILLRMK